MSNQIIEIPDETELGPAMQALSEKQRRFVMAMLEQGGVGPRRAALAAGYQETEKSNGAAVSGHRLAHDPRIQEAIKEVSLKAINAGTFVAVKFVLDTIADETAEKKDRLKAAEMVMNRTGLHAMSESRTTVTHKTESRAEMIKDITLMARTLGVDPQKLLGGAVTEADFVEVKPEDDISDILGEDYNAKQ